jgi:hypothetical protein
MDERVADVYTPLEQWQVRLTSPRSGGPGQQLGVDLCVAALMFENALALMGDEDEVVRYEAFSSWWGSDRSETSILVNRQTRSINATLAAALQRFRLPDCGRWLRVDRFCINQDDNDEKAMQLRKMFNVYNKARRVLAWLGDVSNGLARSGGEVVHWRAGCALLRPRQG